MAPPARSGHTLVYDATQKRIVLFGGLGASSTLNDVWTWDGARWAMLSTTAVPRAREHHAMVCDVAREALIAFGGDSTTTTLGDLWLFRDAAPATHDESCHTGFDGDGDGEIGCADPDCGALCASCGDGVCSASENCRQCPSDCGACMVCGDLHCDQGETCSSCPGDCGVCQ
jgi:hypothetical protein